MEHRLGAGTDRLANATECGQLCDLAHEANGALYNRVFHDEQQAGAVVDALLAYRRADGRGLPVLGLPGSALLAAAGAAGLPVVAEAFADRAYTPGGTLLPRTEPGAVVHD